MYCKSKHCCQRFKHAIHILALVLFTVFIYESKAFFRFPIIIIPKCSGDKYFLNNFNVIRFLSKQKKFFFRSILHLHIDFNFEN